MTTLPLMLTVTAQIPKERTPGKDEKPEDKARLDKEFKDKQKKLEDKLAQDKTYEKRVYLVSSWTVDSLLKDRSQLLGRRKRSRRKTRRQELLSHPRAKSRRRSLRS